MLREAASVTADLTDDHMHTLLGCAVNVVFDEGDAYLIREGEIAKTFYLVRSGRVALEIDVARPRRDPRADRRARAKCWAGPG